LLRAFLWGVGLSRSKRSTGGVGGLLIVGDSVNGQNFCAFDGNGNVALLVGATSALVAAQYEYGPFVEVVRSTGPMAKANPVRFSSKYQDDESDLLYYGWRYFSTSTGSWIARDPIKGVRGGDLYTLGANSPTTSVDVDGRYTVREVSASPTICGGWVIAWIFGFDPTLSQHFYLVQQVTTSEYFEDCSSTDKSRTSVFWEAREYFGFVSNGSDRDLMPPHSRTYGGPARVSGWGKIFQAEDVDFTIWQWGRQVPASRDDYSTWFLPWFWYAGIELDSGRRESWISNWDCCCGPPFDFGELDWFPRFP
jgi:RHS repeat-associated protein